MSKVLKENLTMAEFMSQLLAEVKAINSNMQILAKLTETLVSIQKTNEDFYKQLLEKGLKMRSV
jgi:hypothetical protein